ncbi:hypothetical protein [Sporichthya polymorpha]|uniref:hypothetical protein n=1 Tax=Sporichthya polymorpha TaxID=35751 RepID=UPI00035ED2BF|nr:hypothetical protein [Sporichthya polymorpha]
MIKSGAAGADVPYGAGRTGLLGGWNMFGDDRYYRRSAVPLVPTGWRRNGVIGITATVLMAGGLLLAAATADDADAATIETVGQP